MGKGQAFSQFSFVFILREFVSFVCLRGRSAISAKKE